MSRETQIRAAIAAAVLTVPNVGVAHARERYVSNAAALQRLYLWTPVGGQASLRGWFVRLHDQVKQARVGRRVAVTGWQVTGFIAFDDLIESEVIASELAVAVAAAIEADPTLGGACHRLGAVDGAEPGTVAVAEVAPVSFAGVVCHRAVLRLVTEHFA